MKAIITAFMCVCAGMLAGCHLNQGNPQTTGIPKLEMPAPPLPKAQKPRFDVPAPVKQRTKPTARKPAHCEQKPYVLQCAKSKSQAGLPSFKITEHDLLLKQMSKLDGELIHIELLATRPTCLMGGPARDYSECGPSYVPTPNGDFESVKVLTVPINPEDHGVDEVRVFVEHLGPGCMAYEQCLMGTSHDGEPVMSFVARFYSVKATSSRGNRSLFLSFQIQKM